MSIKSDFEKAFEHWLYESAIKRATTTNYDIAHWGFIQGMKKVLEISSLYQNIYPVQYESFTSEVLSAIEEFES